MSLLLIAPNKDLETLKNAITSLDDNIDVEIWPRVANKDRVTFAVAWNHPKNTLSDYPNLKAVSSLGAGINHLLDDESISSETKLCRLVTTSLKSEMAEYVLQAVLAYRHHTVRYADQRREAYWGKHEIIPKNDAAIGVLGLGEMGATVAADLAEKGYQVNGWSISKKHIPNVQTFSENEFEDFLSKTNILICLLPLTPKTKGILNLDVFKKLKQPAYLINVGRGQHLEEEDLVYALDTQKLTGAWLDVFHEEPLPKNHLFWSRPNIMITPHIAAVTNAKEAAERLIDNYKRALSGMELIDEITRTKGY